MNKKLLQICFLVLMMFLVMGCDTGDKKDDTIVFADDSWASNRFYNEIAQFIIENGYGYQTEKVTGSTAALLTGMAKNEVDVHMEMWSQNMGENYKKAIENGDYLILSINFDDNKQGIYVPTYVIEGDPERGIEPMAPDLKYISDLPDYWEIFLDPEDHSKGRLVGWLTGTETDDTLLDAFEYYGLEETYNYFHPGSETALNSSIKKAYEQGEAWLGYSYDPHWIMGKYDMTILKEEEENNTLESLGSQDIHILGSNSLIERAPDIAEFLGNFSTSSDVANDALIFMEEEDASEYEAAIKFLKENEEMWTEWVPDEIAEDVIEALESS